MPYEILNKRFRSAQKTIDREIHGLTSALNELEKCVESGNSNTGSVVQMLGGVVEKLQTLKRKVNALNTSVNVTVIPNLDS